MDKVWRWGVLAVGALVYLVLLFVPYPGQTPEAATTGADPWDVSVATGLWQVLLPVWLLFGLLDAERARTSTARRAALLTAVVLVGASWFLNAPSLQALGLLHEGGQVLLVGGLTRMAAAALAWWLMDRLDDVGQDGIAWLVVPLALLDIFDWHVLSGTLATVGLLDALAVFASPLLPLALVLLGIAVRGPTFPIPALGSLQVRTVVPLLVLPAAVGMIAETGLVAPPWWVRTIAHTGGTVLALWLVHRRSEGGIRIVPGVVGLGVGLVFAVASVWMLVVASPYGSTWTRTYAGSDHLVVNVEYDRPLVAADLGILEERLVEAGEVEIRRDGPSQLVIDITGTDASRVRPHLEHATRPGHLALRPVDPEFRASTMRRLMAEGEPGRPETWGALPPGRSWGLEDCDLPDGTRAACRAYVLLDAEMTEAHVEDAVVTFSPHGPPAVSVALTPEGATRFGELTSRLVGDQLAIEVDGVLLSVPVINEPIWGGRVHISMGTTPDAETEARALANALRLHSISPTRRTSLEVTEVSR